MHPYEMYQLARQRRDHRLVNIKPGTLYHAVGRLEADGFVEVQGIEREGNRPERTTYAITAAGRQLLRRSVADLLGTVTLEYPTFPFALSEAHNLPDDEVIDLLGVRLSELRAQLAELSEVIAGLHARNLPWAYWLHVEFLQHELTAQATWLEGAIDDIRAGRFAVPALHQADSTSKKDNV